MAERLPLDPQWEIVRRVGATGAFTARRVCRHSRQWCTDPEVWRTIVMKYNDVINDDDRNFFLVQMCEEAIQRSEGGVEFTVRGFGYGHLIEYLTDRGSGVRILRAEGLRMPFDITHSVPHLTHLDELELLGIRVMPAFVVSFSVHCPNLRILRLGQSPMVGLPWSDQICHRIGLIESLEELDLQGFHMSNMGVDLDSERVRQAKGT